LSNADHLKRKKTQLDKLRKTCKDTFGLNWDYIIGSQATRDLFRIAREGGIHTHPYVSVTDPELVYAAELAAPHVETTFSRATNTPTLRNEHTHTPKKEKEKEE
jgi:hypothetical protein